MGFVSGTHGGMMVNPTAQIPQPRRIDRVPSRLSHSVDWFSTTTPSYRARGYCALRYSTPPRCPEYFSFSLVGFWEYMHAQRNLTSSAVHGHGGAAQRRHRVGYSVDSNNLIDSTSIYLYVSITNTPLGLQYDTVATVS